MKLDDPELIAKTTYVPGKFISAQCRSLTHNFCVWPSCDCSCHEDAKEAKAQLAHELSRQGAVKRCVTFNCRNDAREKSQWCDLCHRGFTPTVRSHLTAPL